MPVFHLTMGFRPRRYSVPPLDAAGSPQKTAVATLGDPTLNNSEYAPSHAASAECLPARAASASQLARFRGHIEKSRVLSERSDDYVSGRSIGYIAGDDGERSDR
jgi:hypothetical protein